MLIAAFALGNLLGGSYISAVKNADISQLKADHSVSQRQAAEAALGRLQEAQQRGDALTIRLALLDATRQTQAQETQREIKARTTGRPCLDAGTVRLLNAPAGLKPAALPTPASSAAAADAAFASDTDVGLWAEQARRQYDTCRDRLQAVSDFYPQSIPQEEPQALPYFLSPAARMLQGKN